MNLVKLFVLCGALLSCCALTTYGQTYEEYRAHLVQFEGYSLKAYQDVFGNWTIGIGHKMLSGDAHRLTPRQVEVQFLSDLNASICYAKELTRTWKIQPDEVRVLIVALTYNVGGSGYSSFSRFRQAIDIRDYRGAAKELMRSKWARQLPERAKAYVEILEGVK